MTASATLEAMTPYMAEIDAERLLGNMRRVLALMEDRLWRTYSEIADQTGLQAEYVSAHLRDLRKDKNGSYVVCRRPRGARADGLYEFQVLPPGTDSEWDGAEDKKPRKDGKNPFNEGVIWITKKLIKVDGFKGTEACDLMLRELLALLKK